MEDIDLEKRQIIAIGLLISCFVFFHNNAFAAWKYKKSSAEFGYSYLKYDYKENLDAPLKSTEKGELPGIYAVYTFRWPDDIFANLYTDYHWGETRYNGTLQDGTPSKDRTKNQIIRVEGSLGWSWWPTSHTTISPFIGIGESAWERKLGSKNGIGYDEYYLYQYVVLGGYFVYEPKPYFSVAFKGTFRQMFHADLEVDGDGFETDENAKLGKKYEFSYEVPVAMRFAEHYCLNMTPYYIKRKFGKSNTFTITDGESAVDAVEPSSTSTSKGIRVGLSYIW